jgi:subtilisin family serine protease
MTQILKNLIFITLFSLNVNAQQAKYWVFFTDKDLSSKASISEKTKENRRNLGLPESQISDLPVNKNHLSKLQSIDIQPLVQSKWLNAISANLTAKQISEIKKLDFIKEITPIDSKLVLSKINARRVQNPASVGNEIVFNDDLRVDFVMKQIGIESFLQLGLNGKGVMIGVIDAGFFGANDTQTLKHLFDKNLILGTKDYVNPKKIDYFGERETASDFHGTEVLNAITGRNVKENYQLGLATNANFYLARTDSGNKEFRGEEDNWMAAMEWMDSLGVRLINTSLGYAKGFSNPKESYLPEQMDGKTSVIARAAQMAVEEKGIIVVVSAGNEGDDRSWQIISTPADVEGVIAVGATNELGMKMGYSSIGPGFLSYNKPNVSCYSLFGTSLAAPVITGFVACLLQANPRLSNKKIKEILEKSSNLYPYANNFIGFGIPNAQKAIDLTNNIEPKITTRTIEILEGEKQAEIPLQAKEIVVVFNKKSAFQVISQESIKPKYNFISLKRNPQVKQSTVITHDEVIEVIWKTPNP